MNQDVSLQIPEVGSVDQEHWILMYQQMLRIRYFDEEANQLYLKALMPGLTHMYIGEEAIAVGICEALRSDDYITSTHRGHGHCVAKGAKLDLMFAELLGKESGYCRGKGGSMHIADQDNGNLGANAIVGGSVGIATGAALSIKRLGTDQVAVCFFGEGALNQGRIYECMNMASVWNLPVIYVCENNLYNEYTHYRDTTAGELIDRGKALDILSLHIDGQDVKTVHTTALALVQRARTEKSPAFLVADTYRFHGHHVGDIAREYYRSKEEERDWEENRDPVKLMAQWLLDSGLADQPILDQIEQEVEEETSAAVQFGLDAPYPSESEVDQHVYA